MTAHRQSRAERDASIRAAFSEIPEKGCTISHLQEVLGDSRHENTRMLLERMVYNRVLVVDRTIPRNHKYKLAPGWDTQYDDHINARNARVRSTAFPKREHYEAEEERAPGVPLVLLARQNLHPLQTVWGARP